MRISGTVRLAALRRSRPASMDRRFKPGGDDVRRLALLRHLSATGRPMTRPTTALLLFGVALIITAVAGCSGDTAPPAEPTFYQALSKPDTALDPAAAASMISGYRSNNGLGAVTVDAELMRMASEAAHAMGAPTKRDHHTV